jgi:hypothetical protein
MCLKVLSVASATLLLSLVSIHGVSAEGGCGPGFHRGPYGHCRPNGPVVVAPAAPVVVAPAVVAPVPVVCGVGYRWHPLACSAPTIRVIDKGVLSAEATAGRTAVAGA